MKISNGVKNTIIIIVLGLFIWARPVLAHCPLCTIGAGIVATIAVWLGVNTLVIGVLLGAFAAALGFWAARLIKKKYFAFQDSVVTILVFLSTILPLLPIAGGEKSSVYVSLAGDYGSFLNRTYVVDLFLVGSLLGALIMIISPFLSRQLTKWRKDRMFAYQGITVTFVLLIVSAIILQFAT